MGLQPPHFDWQRGWTRTQVLVGFEQIIRHYTSATPVNSAEVTRWKDRRRTFLRTGEMDSPTFFGLQRVLVTTCYWCGAKALFTILFRGACRDHKSKLHEP